MSAGHGEVLTAAVSARVEEDGRSMRYGGLERAQGSLGGSWDLGEAKGKHWGGGKDVTAVNFAVARSGSSMFSSTGTAKTRRRPRWVLE